MGAAVSRPHIISIKDTFPRHDATLLTARISKGSKSVMHKNARLIHTQYKRGQAFSQSNKIARPHTESSALMH